MNRIDQNFGAVTAAVDWETDSEFKRDYKRDSFSYDQWNQSFAEISYTSSYGAVSLFSEWQSNSHESITQVIPSFPFNQGQENLPMHIIQSHLTGGLSRMLMNLAKEVPIPIG